MQGLQKACLFEMLASSIIFVVKGREAQIMSNYLWGKVGWTTAAKYYTLVEQLQ